MDEFRQHLQATGVRVCINFFSQMLDLCFYISEVSFFISGSSVYFEATLHGYLKVVVGAGQIDGSVDKSFYWFPYC